MRRIAEYLNLRGSYVQPTRRQVFVWALLVGLVVFLSLKNGNVYQVGAYWDDGSYVVLAKSISLAPNYGHMSNPGTPLPTRYPFGFPLLLAPFVYLSNSFQALKSVSFIATLLNMGLLFWGWSYLSSQRSHWWSLAVIAISSLSPMVIGHTGMVMSEPVFTTFMLLSLIMAERVVSNPESRLDQILLGAFLAYAMFVRTVGVFLIFAVLFSMILRLLQRSAYPILVSLGSALVILAGVLIFTNIGIKDLWPQTYINQGTEPGNWGQNASSQFLPRFLEGSSAYVQSHIREAVLPVGGGSSERKILGISNLPAIIGVIVTFTAVVGIVTTTLGGQGLLSSILLFELIYLPVMFLWPWRGARFIYPVQPFIIYQFLSGVVFLLSVTLTVLKLERVRKKSTQLITSGVVIMLALAGVVKSFSLEDSRRHLPDLEVGALWLKGNSNESAVVLGRNPDNIFIYSDRKTLDYPAIKTPMQLKKFLFENGIDYIMVTPELRWRDDGLLAYDNYTKKNFVPLIKSMQEEKILVSVFKSESDLVEVFRVVQ